MTDPHNDLQPLTLSELPESLKQSGLENDPSALSEMIKDGDIAAPDDALLTMKQAAVEYGLSAAMLHKLSFREGGRWKVRRSDVVRYIAELKGEWGW